MLEPQLLNGIAEPESAEGPDINRIQRDLRFVSEAVTTILDSLPIQRRPLPEWVKRLHVGVTWLRRNGFCPCCQTTQVCDHTGKLPNAEFDHWYGRYRNGPEESWLCCQNCNRLLESPAFKTASRSAFESYQQALRPFLDNGQRELF